MADPVFGKNQEDDRARKIVAYRSDDCDEDDVELFILDGRDGNGDWYIGIRGAGERCGRTVRITTSGQRVDGFTSAVRAMFDALRQGRDGEDHRKKGSHDKP